jgi:hypothetical protein
MSKPPKLVIESARALRRLMDEGALTLADLEEPSGPQRAALRTRMRGLVGTLGLPLRSTKSGPGRAEVFEWI